MIAGRDSELQGMFARLETIQGALGAFEHAGHLAVDVRMNVFADLTFFHLELERDGPALNHRALAK